ncbi:uncharacterized protein PITG_22250, partial [Phytophthora infestans T30-4]
VMSPNGLVWALRCTRNTRWGSSRSSRRGSNGLRRQGERTIQVRGGHAVALCVREKDGRVLHKEVVSSGVSGGSKEVDREGEQQQAQARLKDGYKVSRDDVVVNMREPGNLAIAAATVTLASAQVVNPTRMYAVKRLQLTSIMRRAADGCTLVTKTATTHVVEGECWKCKMCTYIDSRVVSYVTAHGRF